MTNVISLKRLAEIGAGFAPPTSSITGLYLDLPANSATVSDSHLIDATIILLMRAGLPMEQTDAAPTDHEFTINPLTGELGFSVINPTNSEQVYVLYFPNVSSGPTMATEPITLAEAKTHLRVTFTDDDVEIYRMISRARRYMENYCNISIVQQRIQVVANICGCWDLPYGPVIEVESVENRELYNGSGPLVYVPSEQEWSVDAGNFLSNGYPRQISTRDRFYPDNRTRITYTAGMESCPDDLKAAILAEIAYRYENRGDENRQYVSDIPGICPAAQALAAPYRVLRWI